MSSRKPGADSPTTIRARRSRPHVAVAAVLLSAVAGASYWHLHADAQGTAPSQPVAAAHGPDPLAAPRPAAAPAPASAAADAASGALAHPMPSRPGDESPAESLRKVQLGLDGSAEQALVAARTLQSCTFAAMQADAHDKLRDGVDEVPPEVKKAFGSPAAVFTKEVVDRIGQDQRRCQVFDAATMARQGELFLKAYEGGAPGAAMSYLNWLALESPRPAVDPALLARMQADVRRAAESGDLATLAGMAFAQGNAARNLGADPVRAQAYREAWFRIMDAGMPGSSASLRDTLAKMSQFLPAQPALTAEQQRAADRLTAQVVEANRQNVQDLVRSLAASNAHR
jgi:hypothetical protein